jgi:hypothetical protein
MAYLSRTSLIWCQVDPIRCEEIKAITARTLTNEQLNAIEGQIFTYSHKFAQGGQSLHVIQTISDAGVPTPNLDTLDVIDGKCHTFEEVAYVCDIYQQDKDQLFSMFTPQNPFIIPAQVVELVPFTPL